MLSIQRLVSFEKACISPYDLPEGIVFTIQIPQLQYRDDLETVDIIYRGRCWMDEPATTGSYSLPP